MVLSESPAVEVGNLPLTGKRRGAVLITGRGTDIAFNLDENAPIEQVARELDAQLADQNKLFSKGGISVNTGNRTLSSDEEEEIRRIFREKSGLKIARFVSADGEAGTGEPPREVEEPPAVIARRQSPPDPQFSSADLARALSGISSQGQRSRGNAMIVRGLVRSGESLRHPGDLVVLGDVHPGSEVVADGAIVVLGALKGLPHAGASGDGKAAIIALEIASPRLRIGKSEAEASTSALDRNGGGRRGKGPVAAGPLIAYVRREIIYVSPFAGRFARYMKGVPYEG